ncbi:MAG: hypothetical protein RL516_541 [Bacteroidota bacterium]|jgi:hypothetical protein
MNRENSNNTIGQKDELNQQKTLYPQITISPKTDYQYLHKSN